jgi:hypothetical protein
MGYYMAGRGDFYRGGGRGDPGFLSFLGGLAKTAVGFIPGIGPIAKGAIDVASTAISKVASRPIVKTAVGIVKAHPVLTAAGGAGAVATAIGAHKMLPSAAGAGMGAAMNGGGGGFGRKRRRMNPYNPRALRRALRRTHSFAKMARQIIRVAKHYKSPKRFKIGHFKKRSKK